VADTGHVAVLGGDAMVASVVGGIELGVGAGELVTAALLLELVVRPAIRVADTATRARTATAPASSGVHPRGRRPVRSEITRHPSTREAM
jgi:hypothetical protein